MRINKGDIGDLSNLRTSDTGARRVFVDDEDLIVSDLCPFRQDADVKIGVSKAFRQLMFKTQVISSPVNALIRNRASHTIEVVNVATTIANILGLNVDLARAIALGHDIGHVPFGHAGEEFLSERLGKKFRHEIFALVRAQKIERLGQGLNLTHQTLSGILHHSRGSGKLTVAKTMSPEATVAMYSDKISYILSDYNDLVKRDILSKTETGKVTNLINQLGSHQRERTNRLILALCRESVELGYISFENCQEAVIFQQVKLAMYELYEQVNAHGSEEVMSRVYDFVEKKVADVNPAMILALMNDEDLLVLSKNTIFDRTDFNRTSVAEQVSFVRTLDPNLDLTDPGLDW